MVLTKPPLMATVPPTSVVRLVNAVAPPTAPLNTVAPEVLTTKIFAPLTVLVKLMSPAPVLVNTVFTPKVTAPLKLCASLVVMVAPFNTLWPFSVKPPLLLSA